MKSTGRNYLKILMVVLLASGLIYAFYNVLNTRIRGQENIKQLQSVTDSILNAVNSKERMECMTSVYLDCEEEDKLDESQKAELIHDFAHKRFYIGRSGKTEIVEYENDLPAIYSKGISPVYSKEKTGFIAVQKDKWYKYTGEKIYASPWRKGKNDQVSYGYLKDKNYLVKIKKIAKEIVDEKSYTKYEAVVKNTLRDETAGKESDNEFRKTLSSHGLNVMDLRKEYPEVYKLLKDTYNKNMEEMSVWVDEEGNLVRIEKDHTFLYYLNVMKENSDKIEQKVGQYGYPRVYSRQEYTYSPDCRGIEIPKDFAHYR